MAKIELEDGWFIESDKRNWSLGRFRTFSSGKRRGKQYEEWHGHFGSLKNALNALLDHRLRASEASTLQELLEELERTKAELSEKLKLKLEVSL